jgi:hypothetical protein
VRSTDAEGLVLVAVSWLISCKPALKRDRREREDDEEARASARRLCCGAHPCGGCDGGQPRDEDRRARRVVHRREPLYRCDGEGGDAAGGFHITGTGTGTATTSDGFSGRFTFWFGGNVRPDGSFNETFTNSNTLGDGSGARILITVASHVTIANGELRVEHEQVNFRCVGKTA